MNKTQTPSTGKTVKRLMGYVLGDKPWRFVVVILCILLSAVASVGSSLFIQRLIDDYIAPAPPERPGLHPAAQGAGIDGVPVPGRRAGHPHL